MKVKVLSKQDLAKFSYSGAEEMKNVFMALKESGAIECRAVVPSDY